MEPPTAEAVLQGVFTLYNDPNNVEKEKASKWLEEFQKSVSAAGRDCLQLAAELWPGNTCTVKVCVKELSRAQSA